MFDKVFSFGKCTVQTITKLLYLFGCVPIFCFSYIVIRNYYLFNTTTKITKDIVNHSTLGNVEVAVHNLPMAILIGVVTFLVLIVLWKIVCEILFLILDVLKSLVPTFKPSIYMEAFLFTF